MANGTGATGNVNTFVGMCSGFDLSSGSQNVAMGFRAGQNISSGDNNTFLGYEAGNNSSIADNGTMIGRCAGRETSGGNNTFIGTDSGYQVTTGGNNTILGRYNGCQCNLDIRTSSNNIVLSDGAGCPRLLIDCRGHHYSNPSNYTASDYVSCVRVTCAVADTSVHSLGQINNNAGVIEISHPGGNTFIPFYANGGGGLGWSMIFIDPDQANTIHSNQVADASFTVSTRGTGSFNACFCFVTGTGILCVTQNIGTSSKYVIRTEAHSNCTPNS